MSAEHDNQTPIRFVEALVQTRKIDIGEKALSFLKTKAARCLFAGGLTREKIGKLNRLFEIE